MDILGLICVRFFLLLLCGSVYCVKFGCLGYLFCCFAWIVCWCLHAVYWFTLALVCLFCGGLNIINCCSGLILFFDWILLFALLIYLVCLSWWLLDFVKLW